MVGAGRLGASLALALRAQGMALTGYTCASAAGRDRAEDWLGVAAHTTLEDLVRLDPDVYLLTVPDQAVSDVASRLGTLLPSKTPASVIHTSGATSVRVLDACRARGSQTLAFHPLQTFSDPRTASKSFRGTTISVTPGAEEAESPDKDLGFALAHLLGARPFLLADDKRVLYHAAAAIACNYFVTLEHQASRLFSLSGLPPTEVLSSFLPLVKSTLESMESNGTVNALTGPLSRGDIDTIRGHLAALVADAPGLLSMYRQLGLATLDIIHARRELSGPTVQQLTDLLNDTQGADGVPS